MAISVTNLSTPSVDPAKPGVTDPKDQKKQVKKLLDDSKTIETLKTKMDKSISEINKKMEDTFGKSAKLLCLLRLDMVADKLDKIDSRLAGQIDAIANAFEKEDV